VVPDPELTTPAVPPLLKKEMFATVLFVSMNPSQMEPGLMQESLPSAQPERPYGFPTVHAKMFPLLTTLVVWQLFRQEIVDVPVLSWN
jgi:hypothetical protein